MLRLSAFSDEAAAGLSGQIQALRRNAITRTELRSVDGKSVVAFTPAEAKRIWTRLNDSGIAVWAIGSPLGKVDLSAVDDAYFDTVKRVCELANVFCTDKVRVFSFFHAYDAREKVLDTMRAMGSVAKRFGVTLYHENEKKIYGDTAARVADLMDNVEGLKFVYDPANFLQAGEAATDTLPLAARCDYYHIKDVVAATGELVPAGCGDGAIDRLLQTIRDESVLTIEPHLAVFDGYDRIDGEAMQHRYIYDDRGAAFDAAVRAVKHLLGEYM